MNYSYHLVCTLILWLLCTNLSVASSFEFISPAPANHLSVVGVLDDPQPDTLLYDDGTSSLLWDGPNYWVRVEFTALLFFDLRSIYFYTSNTPNVADPCSVWVHSDDGGELGDVLAVYTQTALLDYDWNDGNLPSPITFDPGENFFVVLGPIPGGAQDTAWAPLIDESSTGHGALSTNGHYGDYDPGIPGDWMIRCGGEDLGTAAGDSRVVRSTEFALSQNYPNPFNPSTHINFALPMRSDVKLTVFNTLGQQVATLLQGDIEAGFHSVEFNAVDLSAGLYFYKLDAASFTQTRKMMLLK